MNRRLIVGKPYTRAPRIRTTVPFVTVGIVVLNFNTNQQTSFDQRCWVDTGFDGGVQVPQFIQSDLMTIGVEARHTGVTLSGGVPDTGLVCHAYIQHIENHMFPAPGIETELLIRGQEPAYLGLDVLKIWVTEFDGPRQMLSIYD